MGELRRDRRLTYKGKISLIWANDHGEPCARNGECIDVSSTGIKVKVDAQIPTRTVVTVKARELELHGSASVRTCNRVGVRYILGLEFVGGMKWEPPTHLVTASAD